MTEGVWRDCSPYNDKEDNPTLKSTVILFLQPLPLLMGSYSELQKSWTQVTVT